MKEAYVQKMVKVFNEYDRWSLISLSNNSGKNLELKFVSVLRRQFEFSVDSFQIILDRLLESYMQQDSQHKKNTVDLKDQPTEKQNKESHSPLKQATAAETERSTGRDLSCKEQAEISQTQQRDDREVREKESKVSQNTEHSEVEEDNKEKTPAELKKESAHKEIVNETDFSGQTPLKKQMSVEAEPSTQIELRHEPELLDKTNRSTKIEQSEQNVPHDGQIPAHSNHEALSSRKEPPENAKPPLQQKELTQHMGQPEPPKTSNTTQTESLKMAAKRHSADFSEAFSEDQKSNEKDNTHASAPDPSPSFHAEIETPLVDEGKVETETEREKDMEISEETEENLASEAKNLEDTQGIDCSCSTSSVPLTRHNTQPTGTQDTLVIPNTLHTDNSDKTPDTLDAVSPLDTQDILSAPPSLVSDKKTCSERLSHMVVLKHSSPKPPRRMCRKVASSHYPSSASEREPVITPCPDPDLSPSPSPEPQILCDSKQTVSTETNPGPEPNPSGNQGSNLDHTSASYPAPDVVSTCAVDPVSALPQEPAFSQLIPESSHETSIQHPEETHVAFDEKIQPHHTETVVASEQSDPVDSVEVCISRTDMASSNTQEPVHTSETELSDVVEGREQWTKKSDINQPNSSTHQTTPNPPSPSHCVTPPVPCFTRPLLSLPPPCFTPSPPSLSPPPCLTPPSHCLSSLAVSNASSTTSLSSPPMSLSPTSSCLGSNLTTPMLSLRPPPLCLSPPSPCLSPPLLCLTPPEDLVPQVSSDMEPLILNTDSEEHFKESSPQPEISDPQLEDIKEHDYISALPQVEEPISFPIAIPSSTTHALPPSERGSPGESAPPKADEASSSVTENKEVPEVTTDMPEQSNSPQASGSVPAVEVLAESMYGDFEAAMDHLRYRLIATRNPEEIRGGGLLKYSNLLVRDYRPASETQIKTLERYMCSRFFIDFPDVQEQQRKILSYLKNHFIGEERSKYQYLMTLRRVVDDSTVCLMGHERRQTLNMITVLALKVLGEQNIIPNTDHVTCFYQPAPYLAEHSAPYLAEPSYCSYYIPQGGSTLLYQPYPLHLHTQTGLV